MKKRILFIHHSTGGNMLREGEIRAKLYSKTKDVEFWDHSYNLVHPFPWLFALHPHLRGLSDENGHYTGIDYKIKLGNDNPGDYEAIFTKDPDKNYTLKNILGYDVIIFKNCYPTTRIDSDERLERYKRHYRTMREIFDKHKDKTFILFTPPPLRKERTKQAYAKRAIEFANWLSSEKYTKGHPNTHIFNFFGLLAGNDGTLRRDYCRKLPWDSHPNKKANIEVGEKFVEHLSDCL